MLINAVKEAIRKNKLISKNDRIVLGVSGGPDSLALLFLLNSLRREFNLTLHIAHLDHMLRKGSYRDAEFVKKTSARLKIPFTLARINIKALAGKGSLEEVARNCRLGFLFGVARRMKADKIALGHNLDDQAETVLMRILRGSGLYGLAGIAAKRKISGFTVVRPLLEINRREIEAYLKKKGIKPVIDSSNAEDIYFRNKIRNKLMPLLAAGYNRNIKAVLANMADSLSRDYEYLDLSAARTLHKGRRLSLDKLKRMHPAILRLVLRRQIASSQGDLRRITFTHIREIEDLIANRPVNSVVDLPKGLSVIKKKNSLSFCYKNHT
ncbi:MAG: tRNA lysidine(34) synthetase TilS [Candidatus Omnitrophota bacterium]